MSPSPGESASGRDPVLLTQGAYYAITGVWPLVSPGSFQAVTGPKADMWLVKTFGVLVTVVGLVLGRAGLRGGDPTGDVRALAAGSAAALAGADCNYVAKGRIPPTYLVDAAAQVGFVAALLLKRSRSV